MAKIFLPHLDERRACDEGREAPPKADRLTQINSESSQDLRLLVPNCAAERHLPTWRTYSGRLGLRKGGGLRNVAIQIPTPAQLRHKEKSVLVFVRGEQPWDAEAAATCLELCPVREKRQIRRWTKINASQNAAGPVPGS